MGDTLMVEGLRDVEFAASPGWVAGAHSELNLIIADGGTVVQPRSDHFGFVRKLRASISLHTGGADGPSAPAALDADHLARIARFTFYFSQAIGNALQRPRWSAEGRQQLKTMLP